MKVFIENATKFLLVMPQDETHKKFFFSIFAQDVLSRQQQFTTNKIQNN